MKASKPHVDRFSQSYGGWENVPESMREIAEALTHYDLPDGWTASVLHSVWGWEAWVWRENGRESLTPNPVVFETEDEALAYVRSALA